MLGYVRMNNVAGRGLFDGSTSIASGSNIANL